jgi:hypothetical protein
VLRRWLLPLITDLPIILFSLFLLDRMPPYFLRLISLAVGFSCSTWPGLVESWRDSPDILSKAQAPPPEAPWAAASWQTSSAQAPIFSGLWLTAQSCSLHCVNPLTTAQFFLVGFTA